ncbi:hypothetical protein [Actinocorallia libanotica]
MISPERGAMRRIGVGAIVAAGLAAALLDVVLCLVLLGDVMRAEGVGLLAWMATLVLSGCFLVAVAIVLLHCAADWGWCRPGWGFGLLYLLVVVEELRDRGGAYGSPLPMIIVFAYLTTIPFQFAVWARRTAARPARAERRRPPLQWRPPPLPHLRGRLRWPLPVRRTLARLAGGADAQQSRSAALAEESPSARGWNSVANRR